MAEPCSDLQLEYRLVASLRDSLKITDDQLVATGYAQRLLNQAAQRASWDSCCRNGPSQIETGVLRNARLQVQRFDNRAPAA